MRRLVLPCLVPLVASAATYDPELTWRTIRTEHFDLHFHQGEEALAEAFSRIVEEVYDTMVAEMAWEPRRRTEVVLVDRTDSANGFASVVPYNAIVLYATAPDGDSTLSLYEDWPETLFTHELTHVLHMDTHHGLVRLARAVVGRIASTNDLSPWWMVEGLATFQETRHTSGGRGRTPLVDMIKRTAVVEGPFPPLGNLDGLQADPPGGNLRYLFGQDFIQYVADTRGEDVWTTWTHTYGSGLPYLLPSRRVFGRRLVPLYRDWRAHLEARYAEQLAPVEALGIREGRVVSDPAASCTAPAFSPDGAHLVWSCVDPRRGSAIWLADGTGGGPEVILKDRGASGFTWRADSAAFVYAGVHVVSRFNAWSDVWMHELGTDGVQALTSGRRARDPEFSPDGSRLLVVTNAVQINDLAVLTVDRRLTPLTAFDAPVQISTPRYHPDGSHFVVSLWRDGRRDLWLLDAAGNPVRRLTADAALDVHPRWSADGRWLYFASDRSGIPNVYAIEVATERLFQVTNVRTGARHPAPHPDGDRLAYAQYSPDGWEIRILDLDPDAFIDRGLLPAPPDGGPPLAELVSPVDPPSPASPDVARWSGEIPRWRPGGAIRPRPTRGQSPEDTLDSFDILDIDDVFGEERDYPFTIPPRRYNPLPMLVPRYVVPFVQSTPYPPARFDVLPVAFQVTAATASHDVLRHVLYSASLRYRSDADFVSGGFNVAINRFLPVYGFGLSRLAVPFALYEPDPLRIGPDGRPRLTVSPVPYWERRHVAYAQVSYPYGPRSTVFARYSYTARAAKDGLPSAAYRPLIPVRGGIGRLSGGWRTTWAQPTRRAISVEDGHLVSLVAGVTAPWLGTVVRGADDVPRGITQLQVTGEVRKYVVAPWRPNHVFAVRAAAGATFGARAAFLGNYQLGGTFGDGGFTATPDAFRMLRGYPFAADVGDSYWLASAEYRFPIWRIDRGFGTLPVFLRYLSGHLYVDAGNAMTTLDTPRDVLSGALVGLGAEVRLASVLGWSSGITGRLGYGFAATPGGYPFGDPRGAYFRFGGSF